MESMNGYFSLCWLRSNKRVCAVFSGVQRVSVSMLWWHQMSHVTELWVPPSRSLVMRQLLPFITDTHHLCLLVTCIVFTWLNIVTIIHFQWARTLVITADSPRVRHSPGQCQRGANECRYVDGEGRVTRMVRCWGSMNAWWCPTPTRGIVYYATLYTFTFPHALYIHRRK